MPRDVPGTQTGEEDQSEDEHEISPHDESKPVAPRWGKHSGATGSPRVSDWETRTNVYSPETGAVNREETWTP